MKDEQNNTFMEFEIEGPPEKRGGSYSNHVGLTLSHHEAVLDLMFLEPPMPDQEKATGILQHRAILPHQSLINLHDLIGQAIADGAVNPPRIEINNDGE